MRGLLEQPVQPGAFWGVDQGQIGINRGRTGLGQPGGDPPQVSAQGFGGTDPPGGEEMLDQVVPQVARRLVQFPPRRFLTAILTVLFRTKGWGERKIGRDGLQ
ncbi:hypothetical protein [Amycolatopsis sp. H20-H5]|uniref:hypothetical protein n=1 Tax=Amycolatopsis sp. H20-H5 TaxID=3046309 RepID=UPI003FA39874